MVTAQVAAESEEGSRWWLQEHWPVSRPGYKCNEILHAVSSFGVWGGGREFLWSQVWCLKAEEHVLEYDDSDLAELEDITEDAVTESELGRSDENQGDFEDADTQEGDTESGSSDNEEFEGYEDK